MTRPESRKPRPRVLLRFLRRRLARPGWTAARVLEVVHKLLTGGAALAAIVRLLF
jgi:hypothetical protein